MPKDVGLINIMWDLKCKELFGGNHDPIALHWQHAEGVNTLRSDSVYMV